MLSLFKCLVVFLLCCAMTVAYPADCKNGPFDTITVTNQARSKYSCKSNPLINVKVLAKIRETVKNSTINLISFYDEEFGRFDKTFDCSILNVTHRHQNYVKDVNKLQYNGAKIQSNLTEKQELMEFLDSFDIMTNLSSTFHKYNQTSGMIPWKMENIWKSIRSALGCPWDWPFSSYSHTDSKALTNLNYSITVEAIKLTNYFDHRLDMMINRLNATN